MDIVGKIVCKRQSSYIYDKKCGMLVKINNEKMGTHKPIHYCASPVIIRNNIKPINNKRGKL